MTDQPDQQPVDLPAVGAVYNYQGQNYAVTRCEPQSFLVQDGDCWTEAIEFTDHVAGDQTATVKYVMPLADFMDSYESGEITEGGEATQLPADGGDSTDATTKPGGQPEKEPKA